MVGFLGFAHLAIRPFLEKCIDRIIISGKTILLEVWLAK
jgi:hypothetical protein